MTLNQTLNRLVHQTGSVICVGLVLLQFGCSKGGDQFSTLLSDTDGGTGNASVQITYYLPATASVVEKDVASRTFAVSAVGTGNLSDHWTVDGSSVGTNSASYLLSGAGFSVGAIRWLSM